LPQLWQVLSGHMSLVGPRPLPNGEAAQLPATWQFRWQVKPGLFSEWTVDNQRHQSLKLWRELELATLQQGGWRYDLGLVGRTLQQIVAAHWPK
jgi:lipopolysaccharide/colanic/teichoic acid biosynthesis glycosyltransferase